MKLVDSSVLVALVLQAHVHHAAAAEWWQSQAVGEIVMCRSVQQSLLRHLTTAAVLRPYGYEVLANADAWRVWDAVLNDARATSCPEPDGVEPVWRRLSARNTASPKVWMDAYLAAFAIAGGHELVTTDAALAEYPGVTATLLR